VIVAQHRHRRRKIKGLSEPFERAADHQVRVLRGESGRHRDERPEDEAADDDRLARDTVADDAGKRRRGGVHPHERRPDHAKLHIGQPHLCLEQRKHRVDRLAVGVVEEADEPQERDDGPFVHATGYYSPWPDSSHHDSTD
jgi:hypothetical protein